MILAQNLIAACNNILINLLNNLTLILLKNYILAKTNKDSTRVDTIGLYYKRYRLRRDIHFASPGSCQHYPEDTSPS